MRNPTSTHYAISNTRGCIAVTVPGLHPDKATLMVADNFSYLLPRNGQKFSGPEFADLIEAHCIAPKAKVVIAALRNT